MTMDNNELSIKFAVMENQLSTLMESNKRIETSIEKFASLDKTIAEMMASNNYMQQKIIEVERDTAICAANHARETTKIWEEISKSRDNIVTARGMAVVALWFVSAIGVVAGGYLTFLFNTAMANKDTNTKQDGQISQIEKRLEVNSAVR